MKIFVAGLSYKTAPVELREKLAVHASRLRCHGCRLKLAANLSEVVILSTCNRVEIYGVAEKVNGNVHNIFQHLSGSTADFSPHLIVKEGAPAREGAEIADSDGKVIGTVTSGGPSPTLGRNIAMGYVPPAHAALGTDLKVIVRGRAASAEVVALPFVAQRYYRKPKP